MKKKKGISLIVLVITIIVMIILAATIILAINNNNVVDKAKDAVTETNYKQIQEMAQTLWADAYIEGARTQEELEAAVTEGLKDTDTSKYTITVTTTGVEVSVKAETPVEPEEPEVVDKSVFANNTWPEIIEAVQNDAVPTTWAVGDTKAMTIGGTDYNIQIIGKDHDTYSDGTGTAPLTFQLVECYTTIAPMNTNYCGNETGWSGSVMRTTTLPTILSAMPTDVQNAIKAVDKITIEGLGKNASAPATLETTSDKLFLLSEIEVFGSTDQSIGVAEGSRYAYYANGGSTVKTLNDSAELWWLRGPAGSSNSAAFSCVYNDGSICGPFAFSERGVAFAFCF